jgi:hypothetical protein
MDVPCLEPKHRDKRQRQWVHYVAPDGWEPEPGYWHKAINDPGKAARTAEIITEHRTKTRTTTTVTETETEIVQRITTPSPLASPG